MAVATPIKKAGSKLEFWAPLYQDANGKIISPGYVSYEQLRTAWDYIVFTINGQDVLTPGLADVRFDRCKNRDNKKPVGADATTITTSGIKSAEIIIELLLWMPDHKIWLDTYMPILFPKPNKSTGQATFKVKHPLFSQKAAGITAVVIHSFEGPLRHSIPGAKIFRLRCTEWLPTTSKKAGGTAPPPSRAAEESNAAQGLSSQLPGKGLASKTGK